MKPTVFIVGADKGGVGKTTITRTLLDYLSANLSVAQPFVRSSSCGGRGGIRTHERLAPLAVFKTAAFNHSATRPLRQMRDRFPECKREGAVSGPAPARD